MRSSMKIMIDLPALRPSKNQVCFLSYGSRVLDGEIVGRRSIESLFKAKDTSPTSYRQPPQD
jgi:hypothetical protein